MINDAAFLYGVSFTALAFLFAGTVIDIYYKKRYLFLKRDEFENNFITAESFENFVKKSAVVQSLLEPYPFDDDLFKKCQNEAEAIQNHFEELKGVITAIVPERHEPDLIKATRVIQINMDYLQGDIGKLKSYYYTNLVQILARDESPFEMPDFNDDASEAETSQE